MKPLRIISILALAFLVMLSSTNFMVGIHFCQGEIQNVGLFTKATGCEKEQSLPPCHRNATAPCCEDETIVHASEELKHSVFDFQVHTPLAVDVVDPRVLISELIPASEVSRAANFNYQPPEPSLDIPIINRTFRIFT